MKIILITGASGFIGKKLSSELSKKYTVLKISRSKKKDNYYTWKDLPTLEADIVIHLSGKAHDKMNNNYEEYYKANVNQTEKIVDFCCKKKVSQLMFLQI